MSRILIITTSLRAKSNSDLLAERLAEGARDAGNSVECVSLKDKKINYCVGCLACQKTQKCVIGDDAPAIAEKVKDADILVFATPIYYYEMSGQMKTLLDRLNPLYTTDYRFRKIYMLTTAAESEDFVPERAVNGLKGWVECFEKAELSDSIFFGGVTAPGEAFKNEEALKRAYEFGRAM